MECILKKLMKAEICEKSRFFWFSPFLAQIPKWAILGPPPQNGSGFSKFLDFWYQEIQNFSKQTQNFLEIDF